MPAAAQTADPPTALGRVLSVVRRLIDYGRQLADKVQQHAAGPGLAHLARPFGTADIAVILARITAGLRRAAALEARLCQCAARGRDLTPTPLRLPAVHVPRPARVTRPAAQPEPQRVAPTPDPHLERLPTEEAIAAEVRRRPVGAVIVDICRDLGIAPGDLDREFWDELHSAIIAYGGSLTMFVTDLPARIFAFGIDDAAAPGWPAVSSQSPALATGPP